LALPRVLTSPAQQVFRTRSPWFLVSLSQSATMAHCHIVPVPAASQDGPTVLLEVKQTGSSPLDVRLVGCEGESERLFVATRKIASI
jgi:hypothetical protein